MVRGGAYLRVGWTSADTRKVADEHEPQETVSMSDARRMHT